MAVDPSLPSHCTAVGGAPGRSSCVLKSILCPTKSPLDSTAGGHIDSQNCSTFTVIGQDFMESPRLGCKVRPVMIENNSGKPQENY